MNPSENKIMALLAQWLCTVMKLYLLIKSINFYLPLKKIVAYQWIRSVMKLYLLVKSTNFYLPLKKIGRFCYFLYVIITWGGSYKVIYCTRLPNGTTWTVGESTILAPPRCMFPPLPRLPVSLSQATPTDVFHHSTDSLCQKSVPLFYFQRGSFVYTLYKHIGYDTYITL